MMIMVVEKNVGSIEERVIENQRGFCIEWCNLSRIVRIGERVELLY